MEASIWNTTMPAAETTVSLLSPLKSLLGSTPNEVTFILGFAFAMTLVLVIQMVLSRVKWLILALYGMGAFGATGIAYKSFF